MTVVLDASTDIAVQALAKARNSEPGEVVAMLLNHWLSCDASESRSAPAVASTAVSGHPASSHEVAVYGTYFQQQVTGVYNTATKSLRITHGPAAGTTYSSASAAASAVVKDVNPARVNASKNGLLFWRLANGRDLHSLG